MENRYMKETIVIWLKGNWFKIGLLSFLVIPIGGAFYWYEWRPSQIRIKCWENVRPIASKSNLSAIDAEILLNICLTGKGLKK